MSKKSKKGHSIKNPVVFSVSIDTDDDFTVDGETQVKRNVTVTGVGDVSFNLVQHLLSLHYESKARSTVKIDDFKKLIGCLDFKEGIQKLMMSESSFDYSSRISANSGNQSIVVTLEKNA